MDEAMAKDQASRKIRLGISACLLGQEVRFDGGHKRDAYIMGSLSQFFEFIPVCPEAAVGLGIPRQPIRLVKTDHGVRAIGVRDPRLDPTEALADYGYETAGQLSDISGYLLKKDSPSCGMERVKIYNERGMAERKGVGIFAASLMQAMPLLPVEEEGRLGDPVLRDNFIERVFVYDRWQNEVASDPSAARVVEFHSDHKFLIMAHSQKAYRELGRLVADAGKADIQALASEYVALLMKTLAKPATSRQHVNVLQHLMGYLKKQLDAADRAELAEVIQDYRNGLVPLIVPITLLNHHFRRHPHPYVQRQHYLNPHPRELMLRNRI